MAFPIDWQNPRSGFTHGQTGRSRYILSQGAMRDKGLLASLGALTQAEQGGDPELLRRARQDIMSNRAIQVIRGSEDPMQDFDIIAEAADENRLETKGAPGPKDSVGPEIPTTQGEHPMPTGPAPILEAALKAIKLPATPTTAPAQPAPVGPQPEQAQPAAPVPAAAKPLAQWTGRDYADWEAEAKSYVTGEVKQPERLAKLIEQAEKDYSMDWWGTEQSRWSPKTIASEIGRRRRRGITIEDIARDLGGFPEEGKLEKDIKRAEANISAITGGEKGDASRKRIYEGALKRDPEGKFFGPDLNRIREQLGNLGEYPNPYRLGKLEEDKRELSREDADHAQAAIDKVFTGKVKARDVPNPDYDPLATEGPTAQKTIKGQETVLEPGAMEFQTGNAYRKKYPELGTKEAISRIIYKGKEEFTGDIPNVSPPNPAKNTPSVTSIDTGELGSAPSLAEPSLLQNV